MKTFNKFLMVCLAAATLVACDKHDKLDDLVFVGKMAPTVYWAVTSTTVTAGDSVPFTAQYYTTGESPVSHLEAWYDIVEIETKDVSAPLLVTFSYSVTSNIETQRRISSSACRYEHSEAYGENFGVNSMGDTTRFKTTYKMSGKFPTSNTLSTIAFGDGSWDSAQVCKYFGDDFMQKFKDTIELTMRGALYPAPYNKVAVNNHWQDYQSAWTNMRGLSGKTFAAFLDSVKNETESMLAGYDIYDYFFKDSVLPNEVDSMFQTVTFADLISSGSADMINFKRSYKLNSQLKCFDKAGTAGLSLQAVIELN